MADMDGADVLLAAQKHARWLEMTLNRQVAELIAMGGDNPLSFEHQGAGLGGTALTTVRKVLDLIGDLDDFEELAESK